MNRFMFCAGALVACVASLASFAPTPARSTDRIMSVPSEPARAKAARPPVHWRATSVPASRVARLAFGEMPVRRLLDLERHNARDIAKPTQIGLARTTAREGIQVSLPALDWLPAAKGGHVARIEVHSPDALGLRVGLLLQRWDSRIELRVGGSASGEPLALISGQQASRLANEQLYWTPSTDGDRQTIELYAPEGVPTLGVRVQVPQISHLIADSRHGFKLLKSGEAGACNVDTVCRVAELGPAYEAATKSVAKMVFVIDGGTYACTGTLLNDADTATQIPWFYSAHHCISTQAVANTLETWWNWESTTCGERAPGQGPAYGATYLYSDPTTDGLLLRLGDAPGSATFAGWDARPLPTGVRVFAIHHPAGDRKKVSEGQHVSTNTAQHIVGWTRGTTEGGSSGSGLFVPDQGQYLVRGGLFRGSASCANTGSLSNKDNRDEYSRFDLVFAHIEHYLRPPNVAPTAAFGFVLGLDGVVSFTDASTDRDGQVVAYQWTFGDGTTSTERSPTHTYPAGGIYTATLKVIDNRGGTATTSKLVRTPTMLLESQPLTLAGPTGWAAFYRFTAPMYASNLKFTLSGGTGNADLYLSRQGWPNGSSFQWASRGPSNAEALTFAKPAGGYWYIMVHGKQAFSGATLKVTYDGGDKPVTLYVDDLTMTEGRSGRMGFRTSTTAQSVTFTVTVEDGTAIAGVDYEKPAPQTVTVPPGSLEGSFAMITLDDALIESSETVKVRITNLRGGVFATDGDATFVIKDNDGRRGINDFDGDNRSDVFWRHATTGANDIWKGANATTRQATPAVTDPNWTLLGSADFNGDEKSDVLWHNSATGANVLWMAGNASNRVNLDSQPDPNLVFVAVGRFGNYGVADIAWRDTRTGSIVIWTDGRSENATVRTLGLNWTVVGSGLFSTADKVGLVAREPGGHVCLMWSDSWWCPYGPAIVLVTDPDMKVAGVGDFDGDNEDDVLWRNVRTGANTIFISFAGEIRRNLTAVTDLNWKVAAVGDYNDDGIADILWRNDKTGANDVWYSGNSALRKPLAAVSDLRWRVAL
ncbi:PKD domain-containing protein [Agrilutibacter solisilvae]|uniref:PKD domain-containing protein n=1 Tax=Agrilutibacter solisilvae TaxID=2763317 RepID=A0A975AT93_9GAMM|nr:PKD domain-containing protein [Lysobacter solisilvae]QSX79582.1 PKD domain-containing protein [Lysobacter solisilvae]